MIGRPATDSVSPAALTVGLPGRMKRSWHRSYRLGEPCVIPLSLVDPAIETRLFLKHDGISYLEPFGDWAARTDIHFLPEAPGDYTVLVEWRSATATGWTEATFVLGPADADRSPRLVKIDRHTQLWAPSAWEAKMAAVHEKAALALAAGMIRPDAVMYDVGANLGLYSILLSRMAGPGGYVYSVEASPVALYFLQANLGLNRVPNYEILPVAILGMTDTTEFRINYRNLAVGIAGPIPYLGKPGHVINVSALPLDDVIERHDLKPPDFIKMDIEGAEVHAITGMRNTIARYRPAILMELHGQRAARGTLEAIDWSGYTFQEASAGRTFAKTAEVLTWFPDACIQVLARPIDR